MKLQSIGVTAGFVGLWLSANSCGGGDTKNAACSKDQLYSLTEPFEAHACMHQVSGPFENISAAESPEGGPELRNPHTAYRVQLASTPVGYQGWVTFRARDTFPYAFFLDVDTQIKVFARGEEGKAPLCSVSDLQATSVCPALPRVRFYDLERKASYAVFVGPLTLPQITIVVEQKF